MIDQNRMQADRSRQPNASRRVGGCTRCRVHAALHTQVSTLLVYPLMNVDMGRVKTLEKLGES
jgi:hypothetical protein